MKKLAWSLLLTGALGLGFAACGGEEDNNSSSSSCSSDNDCKGDRVCTSGACVDPSGGGGGGGGGGTTDMGGGGGGGGFVGSCCLNGSFYSCPSSDAVDACSLDDGPGSCTRDASQDASACGGGGGGGGTTDMGGGGGGGGGLKATGATCEENSECQGSVCIVRSGGNDILGYCSERCDSFADCPTFWDCEELGNAAGKYCVEN